MPRISLELIQNKNKEILDGGSDHVLVPTDRCELYTRYHKLDVFHDRKRKYYFEVCAFAFSIQYIKFKGLLHEISSDVLHTEI